MLQLLLQHSGCLLTPHSPPQPTHCNAAAISELLLPNKHLSCAEHDRRVTAVLQHTGVFCRLVQALYDSATQRAPDLPTALHRPLEHLHALDLLADLHAMSHISAYHRKGTMI